MTCSPDPSPASLPFFGDDVHEQNSKCLSQLFIFCTNSRKSNGDVPEECSEPELNAKQRSDSPICKGNQTPNRSGGDTKDLDDITCKKVGGWPAKEALFLHHHNVIHVTFMYCGCSYS